MNTKTKLEMFVMYHEILGELSVQETAQCCMLRNMYQKNFPDAPEDKVKLFVYSRIPILRAFQGPSNHGRFMVEFLGEKFDCVRIHVCKANPPAVVEFLIDDDDREDVFSQMIKKLGPLIDAPNTEISENSAAFLIYRQIIYSFYYM